MGLKQERSGLVQFPIYWYIFICYNESLPRQRNIIRAFIGFSILTFACLRYTFSTVANYECDKQFLEDCITSPMH